MSENFESVKMRCLIDTERAKREDCADDEESQHNQLYRKYSDNHMENKMADRDLRDALIRLAYKKPELREDLLPLITKHAAMPLVHSLSELRYKEKPVQDWIDRNSGQLHHMMGGKGWFEGKGEANFESGMDFMRAVKLGNNTVFLSVAKPKDPETASGLAYGRGFLTAMPSWDAKGLARQGISCVRVHDAAHVWFCYVNQGYAV